MKWTLVCKEDVYTYEKNPWWKSWLISDLFTRTRHIIYCNVSLTPVEKAIVERSDLGELAVFKDVAYEYYDSYYEDRKQLMVHTVKLNWLIDRDFPVIHIWKKMSIEPHLDAYHKRLEEVAGIIKQYADKPSFTRTGEA